MTKKLVILVLFLIGITSYSQIDFGIKGGINYNFAHDATITINNSSFTDTSLENFGYTAGLFIEFKIPNSGLSIRPEFLYTTTINNYEDLVGLGEQTFSTQKIEIPLLLGIKIIGPFRVVVGPSFQYALDSNFTVDEFREFDKDQIAVGFQVGAGLKFKKFDIDLRLEKGITNATTTYAADVANAFLDFDTRPNQLTFAVSYYLW
jgi:hypothetical protein